MVQVKAWWDQLNRIGSAYGYFPNAAKSWLGVKEVARDEALILFEAQGCMSLQKEGGYWVLLLVPTIF